MNMLSSYRLGDLLLVFLTEDEKNEILVEHPNSIGSKYILEKRNNPDNVDKDNIDVVTKIILEHIEQNIDLLPKDIETSTVIHVRLGDVLCGNHTYEKEKRPFDIDYIKSLIPNSDKMYVIGKCHFSKVSSTNYEECIISSNEYLENVINSINAEHFDSGSADLDLCCAIKSKIFIQGRGFFSKLIVEIRKKLNLENIETQTILVE